MLSTKQAKFALRIIIPVFIAVFSICVLAVRVPETKFIKSTVESLEESKKTVTEFSGASMATSLALSALPDDFASPLAGTLANLNEHFIVILIAIFLERLIVIEGTKISFVFVIPIACGLYILSVFIKRDFIRNFAYKLVILGLALILAVPCSTHFTNVVCADYLTYVDETISETNAGADKINEVMADGEGSKTIFEKLSDTFQTAMQGISDLLAYFNNVIKKCINSVAILIVTTIVTPLLILFFFRWLLKELFQIDLSAIHIGTRGARGEKRGKDREVPEIGEDGD